MTGTSTTRDEMVERRDRTLAEILIDIQEAEHARAKAEREQQLAVIVSFEEDEATDIFAAADDRLLALQDEARALIHALTGVRWSAIERVL